MFFQEAVSTASFFNTNYFQFIKSVLLKPDVL